MGRTIVVIGLLSVSACGRIGFSAIENTSDGGAPGGGDGSTDGPQLVTPTSCASLAPTCGPHGDGSCCGSPLVPGGTFYRSYDVADDGMFTDMSYPATVGDFRLDTYEITVGRFRQFMNAGYGTAAQPPAEGAGARVGIANSGWDPAWVVSLVADTPTLTADLSCDPMYETWTDAPGANESLAMNCITWYESFAFCVWDGGFLPTEAEWNYAAAGGAEQRAYPWSTPASATTMDCTYANFTNAGNYCVDPPNGAVSPVGAYSPQSDGKWGQADLAGNLWEKVLDSWDMPYLSQACDGCADLSSISTRTVRGGAFNADVTSERTGNRYYDPPDERYIEMGVRCARMP